MPHAYTEDQLVEQPAIGLFAELGWTTAGPPPDAGIAGEPPTPLPVLPEAWPHFWRHGQWNELRARIAGNPPHITTWINGVKFMEWQETEVRHPDEGGIALQVHGGGDYTKQFVRYRNIQVKELKSGEIKH